jgi:hypothetical protein
MPSLRDERRHSAGSDRWWAERYRFELRIESGWLGIEYTLFPRQRIASFVSHWVPRSGAVILCRDDEVPLPAQPAVLEIRSSALWSHAICEEPLERWTVAMEAYALALDPSDDAGSDSDSDSEIAHDTADERGERVGMACDIEWERVANTGCVGSRLGFDSGDADGTYEVTALAYGDLQLDDEVIQIHEAQARWTHAWGDVRLLEPTTWVTSSLGVAMYPYDNPSTLDLRWRMRGPDGQRQVVRHTTVARHSADAKGKT